MRPTLAEVCCLPSAVSADVEDFAAGHCHHLELWLTKVEQFLRDRTLADLRQILDQHAMATPVASMQGGLLASQGEARREAWTLFERRLALCRELGVETLVIACDIPTLPQATDLERIRFSLQELGAACGRSGVRAALEFQATSAFGNNLQTLAALIAEIRSPHLGVCLDLFHFHVGPSKPDDLGLLSAENLFHVQLCDLADVPREFARDAHRILPGEGDIRVDLVVDLLKRINYQGCVSIEVLNPTFWEVGPRQFGEVAMTCLRRLLGLAQM